MWLPGVGRAVQSSSPSSGLDLNGLGTQDARDRVLTWLKQEGHGEPQTNYKLRDWLFARQRYWGEPFPIVYPEGSEVNPMLCSLRSLLRAECIWVMFFKTKKGESLFCVKPGLVCITETSDMRHPRLLRHYSKPGLVTFRAWKASLSGACPKFPVIKRVFISPVQQVNVWQLRKCLCTCSVDSFLSDSATSSEVT